MTAVRADGLRDGAEKDRGDVALLERAELLVDGMSCASCASRVERTLARYPGVAEARVNFASAHATVLYDPAAVSVPDLERRVGDIGYGLAPVPPAGDPAADPDDAERRRWLRCVIGAWPLALVVMALTFGFADHGWARWLALPLAGLVQFVFGWPILSSGLARARHLSANMDTLIALGTLAAFFYSVAQLLSGGDLYFETSARCSSAAPRRPACSSTARSGWCRSSRCTSVIGCACAPARRCQSTA